MTPLAHSIARHFLEMRGKKSEDDRIAMSTVQDIHCFECTEITDLAMDLANTYLTVKKADSKYIFLPAPRTWIEIDYAELRKRDSLYSKVQTTEGYPALRMGLLLTEDDEFIYFKTIQQYKDNHGDIGARFSDTGHISKENYITYNASDGIPDDRRGSDSPSDNKAMIFAFLACINHPKIIGRRQHMPHRGLEKRLIRSFGVGKFPLHAWTEIRLEVTPTHDARCDPSIEAHYTGKRALHFCRAHLRLWNGELIFISSHWRGDPALGIKQSRYKVTT